MRGNRTEGLWEKDLPPRGSPTKPLKTSESFPVCVTSVLAGGFSEVLSETLSKETFPLRDSRSCCPSLCCSFISLTWCEAPPRLYKIAKQSVLLCFCWQGVRIWTNFLVRIEGLRLYLVHLVETHVSVLECSENQLQLCSTQLIQSLEKSLQDTMVRLAGSSTPTPLKNGVT